MATAWRMPEFQPTNALLNFAPLNQGLATLNQTLNQERSDERANRAMAIQEGQFDIAKKRDERDAKTKDVQRIGRMAQVIDQEQDPARRADLLNRMYSGMPEMKDALAKNGIDPADVARVPKFLMAEAGAYDPLGQAKTQAEIKRIGAATRLAGAQADYYKSRATPQQASPAPAQDPLAGAGLDDEGRIVTPGASPAPSQGGVAVPDYVPSVPRGTVSGPGTMVVPTGGPNFGGRMNLGGPVDDIDRSMRLDEGRPQGVQVAQAGGAVPSVPGVRPELMGQAMSRFGRTGMTSPEVPGMVTDAGRNRRVDVTATREMQGQRAFNQVTPEQQERLMRFRIDQELWTGMHKRPPRPGYYYGEDGREMSLTDKNFKGDREAQAVALLNMNKIEAASKQLLNTDYITRTAAGALNIGQTGQSFADMKQGAMGLAYALSGKTVAVAEMRNFIEAYGPVPGDSAERIQNKTQRMRDFYQALLTASRGGESYETAFARAMSATGLKNPDGSPAGQPAAASAGAPRNQPPVQDLRGMSTDDLIRRLNGGR